MKHTDENIREIFSDKLRELEVEVPESLWNAVSSKLPDSVPGGTPMFGVAAKWVAVALLSIGVAGLVLWKMNDRKEVSGGQPANASSELIAQQESDPEVADSGVMSGGDEATIQPELQSATENIEKSTANPLVKAAASVPDGEKKSNGSQAGIVIPNKTEQTDNRNDFASQESNQDKEISVNNDKVESVPSSEIPDQPSISVVAIDKDARQYFFMASVTDAKSYEWDFGDGFSNEMSPTHQFDNDGDYEVVLHITNSKGLKTTVKRDLTITTPGKLEIPKNIIITPNGDGLNDRFDVTPYAEGIVFNKTQIRNQSGEIIFESDGQTMWDGTDMSGAPCAAGYYQYLVRGTDRNQDLREKRGLVYLSR